MSIEQPVDSDAGGAAAEAVAPEVTEPLQPKKDSNAALGFFLFLVLLAVLCGGSVLLSGGNSPTSAAAPTRASSKTGRLLVSDSGKVDKVSRDFDVPSGCPRQKLTFEAILIKEPGPGGFVNFRIRDTEGDPADSAIGIFDLEMTDNGSGYWSLSPGRYYVEMEGYNADWSYKVHCQ